MNDTKYETLPMLVVAKQTIPLIRRVAKLTEKGRTRYIIRLPLELNHLWEQLYKTRRSIVVHIEIR